MSDLHFIKIENNNIRYIKDTLYNLQNSMNRDLITPILKEIEELRSRNEENHVEIDRMFIKKIYDALRKVQNNINNVSVENCLNILKEGLLSYKPKKQNIYNIALSMTFFEQGFYDKAKGLDIVDYPIFIKDEEVSDWMAGWLENNN